MSKRRRKKRDRKRKRRRTQQSYDLSRKMFALNLHRAPCLWDVLMHELAVALAGCCRQVRHNLQADTFRFNDRESATTGWMLARGFDILVSQQWPAGLEESLTEKLWNLDESLAEQISEFAASHCFDPLIRKYVEDTQGLFPGRPHSDLDQLTAALGKSLSSLLISRCPADGDLHKCLLNPLAGHKGYFPDNDRPVEPAGSSGDPLRDVYRLGLTIYDKDDGGDIKWKLVHFVRTDPWLFAENRSFVQNRENSSERKERINSRSAAIDEATDEFVFRATRLAGKTPIQLFMERQKNMSERQRQRLLRWNTENFYGIFRISDTDFPFVNAVDIPTDKSYRLTATKPDALRNLNPGDLLFSRVMPWDDHWLLSGIQQKFEGAGKDQNLVSELKRRAQFNPYHRPVDNQDPGIQEGFKIQKAQYKVWMELFGSEELLFEDGVKLGAALNRFQKYYRDEMPFSDTGQTMDQLYQQKYGKLPPEPNFSLPDDLLEAKDTAAFFDRLHGLAFYVGYGLFRSAFEGNGTLTGEQIQRVWDYLIDDSTDYWLFQRMRDQFPERTEYVFKEVLRDKYFQLDRDFEAVLRKFKGEAMRRPVRPMVTVIDTDADSKR